jgi:hypothetical protein
MKKMVVLFTLIFCQIFLWGNAMSGQTMFVFVAPVEYEKTNLLRESPFLNSKEHALFFQNLGISTYCHWVQKIQDRAFLMHLCKGDDVMKSFELLKSKIQLNDETAIQINRLYLETLDIDLRQKDFFADVRELTPMLQVDVEKEDGYFTKEYCFIYPILPFKEEKLQKMFQEKSEYWNQQAQDIYRHRGISKQQLWIQETENASFLVIYQEITGPVTEARKKYLHSKEEQFSKNRSMEFSEVTGLSYEELLPKLESLFDSEILD